MKQTLESPLKYRALSSASRSHYHHNYFQTHVLVFLPIVVIVL
jgi:hypothetical protein